MGERFCCILRALSRHATALRPRQQATMAFMLQTAPSLLNVRQPLLITAIAAALLAGCATRSEPPAAAVSEPAQPAKTEQGTDEAAMESPIQASNFAHWKQEFAPRARAAPWQAPSCSPASSSSTAHSPSSRARPGSISIAPSPHSASRPASSRCRNTQPVCKRPASVMACRHP